MSEIACSLNASDYRARLAEMAAVARDALRAREEVVGGQRLTFAATPDVRERLERIVAAEATCCAFLSFDLRPDGDELRLDVTGPEDAAPIIEELFARDLSAAGLV